MKINARREQIKKAEGVVKFNNQLYEFFYVNAQPL